MLTLMQTPAEQQLECNEGDSLSQSDTPTQSQDSDQLDSHPNGNTPSTPRGCPVCKVTFCRAQERCGIVPSTFDSLPIPGLRLDGPSSNGLQRALGERSS